MHKNGHLTGGSPSTAAPPSARTGAHLWCPLASRRRRPVCRLKTAKWTGSTDTKGHRVSSGHSKLTVPPQSNSDPELGVSLCLQSGRPWWGHAQEQGKCAGPRAGCAGGETGAGAGASAAAPLPRCPRAAAEPQPDWQKPFSRTETWKLFALIFQRRLTLKFTQNGCGCAARRLAG